VAFTGKRDSLALWGCVFAVRVPGLGTKSGRTVQRLVVFSFGKEKVE
jgi:hypothetical protein